MTSEQSIGRQEPLNCQCEGLLVLRNKSDLNFLFFRFENHCAFSINNIMYSAMFTLFPFTQTYTKKKHEVLDFINQMASVNGFVCFCPRGPIVYTLSFTTQLKSFYWHKIEDVTHSTSVSNQKRFLFNYCEFWVHL